MEDLRYFCRKHKKVIWILFALAGFLVVSVSWLAYFVLGSKCYIQIHDQLDGHVLNYIYSAKYLFSGDGTIPEFMNGMPADTMAVSAPIGVLFYKVLPPFAAFAAMHIFVIAVGYIGMFLLAGQVTESALAATAAAGIFAYLPSQPVYGLYVLGQPLLLWALIRIYQTAGKKKGYFLYVLLYCLSSSLVLVGFAWVALLALVWAAVGIRERSLGARGMGAAFLLLFGSYLVCNVNLLKSSLGIGASYVSHREEMVVATSDFWEYFVEILLEGGSHGKSYHLVITLSAVLVLACTPLWKRFVESKNAAGAGSLQENMRSRQTDRDSYRMLAVLFGFVVCISAAAAFWRTPGVAELRTRVGGAVKYFQADRIYLLLPLCWYLMFALCLQILLVELKSLWALRYGMAFGGIAALCFMVYQNSTIYHNLRLMIFPDTYHLMNWDDYYAEDVFEQIDAFIGKDKSSYRTVSLGITPAAALYNGFYCLDGYSNLYPLEYKHAFREIIAKELEKSEELRVYFDAWGNRCYLFNGETGNYMLISGDSGGSFVHLDLNTRKLYEMGGRYLFAAMPIDNAEEMGLSLIREEPFQTPESYYKIWVYEVGKM